MNMKNKLARRRSKNLDDEAIEKIVQILDVWDLPKLTWEVLIEKAFQTLRARYTRQALNNYARIKDAYVVQKKKLASDGNRIDKNITPDQQKIARLEAENARLKRENHALLEQFNRWVYNGYTKQMDSKMREFMNQPLPVAHREPSKAQ